MSLPSAVRRALLLPACAAGLFALAPDASTAEVVTSADLRYDRAAGGGTSWWRSSFAVASPAAEFGLPPVALRTPAWLVPADLAGPAAAPPSMTRGDQLALQARTGPGRWHGTLVEVRADWRRYLGGEQGGLWFSLGTSGVAGGDRSLRSPLIGIGGAARWQRFQLTAQVDQTPGYTGGRDARTTTYWVLVPEESITVEHTVTDPAVPGEMTTITRMQVRTAYRLGRLGLEAAGGADIAPGSPARRWMRGGMDLMVLPAVSMFASYGASPSPLFVEESHGRPQAAVGMRLTPAPRVAVAARDGGPAAIDSWRIRRTGDDRYRLTLRASGAKAVELMGDMTDWQPVPLERTGGSSWEATLTMAPGVHQVLVRVDGRAWTVPPRMSSTESEFAGTVGVLVVD